MPNQRTSSVKPIWAYSYQIVPPQPADRLRAVATLLDHARADAKREGRIWEGRVLREQMITHILVVADSPNQDREVNGGLAAALDEMGAAFSITTPLAMADEPEPPVALL